MSFVSSSACATIHCNHPAGCPNYRPAGTFLCKTHVNELHVYKCLNTCIRKHRTGLLIEIIPVPTPENLIVRAVQEVIHHPAHVDVRIVVVAKMSLSVELLPKQFNFLRAHLNHALCSKYGDNFTLDMSTKCFTVTVKAESIKH
jgi:hypothetical protein